MHFGSPFGFDTTVFTVILPLKFLKVLITDIIGFEIIYFEAVFIKVNNKYINLIRVIMKKQKLEYYE